MSWLLEEEMPSPRGCPSLIRKRGERGRGTPKSRSPFTDTPSLSGFLPTHRPEPPPEPRPGPERPLPSIPAWSGPEIPESGAVEGIEDIDGGITGGDPRGELQGEDLRIGMLQPEELRNGWEERKVWRVKYWVTLGTRVGQTWVYVLCQLGKSFNISEPQFPHL